MGLTYEQMYNNGNFRERNEGFYFRDWGGNNSRQSASNARTNLGLGSIATQASNSIAVTGGTMSGVLITLPSYAVSALPSAGTAGRLVFCTDGDGGSKCLAVDDGTAWKRIALGATVST